MELFRLAYQSRLTAVKNFALIRDIIEVAKVRNKALGLSGVLVVRDDFFFQVLEGEAVPLNQLYCRLMKDTRHADLCLLRYEQVPDRLFQEWSMRSLDFTPAQAELLADKYQLNELRPYPTGNDAVLGFIQDLRQFCKKV